MPKFAAARRRTRCRASSTVCNISDVPAGGTHAGAVRPLRELARLDTCVTVVDAASLLENMHSLQTLKVGVMMVRLAHNG